MIRKLKNIAHGFEADLARLIYKRNTKIPTIGVTGTDGKTTTASLIFHILKTAGFKPAMITTVGAQIDDKTYETGLHTTTPTSFVLQKYIAKAIDSGCNILVLEITSHALDQNRAHGIKFEIGVLTNISHEHLDYHGTYEKYAQAKCKLFKHANIAILNKDDESFTTVNKILDKIKTKLLTYSVKSSADFTPKGLGINFDKISEFNAENFIAASSVAQILEIDKKNIEHALKTFTLPEGRQEIIYDEDFKIIVDFAHTPNSFAKILPVIKRQTKGKLIHVFGAAGARDASKRPLMGKIASENDDIIILTAEDPRKESLEHINKQIRLNISGFQTIDVKHMAFNNEQLNSNSKYLIEIPDRKEAIEFAVKIAQKGDTIITTGKGHEKSINLGHGEVPWNEQEAVRSALISIQRGRLS